MTNLSQGGAAFIAKEDIEKNWKRLIICRRRKLLF